MPGQCKEAAHNKGTHEFLNFSFMRLCVMITRQGDRDLLLQINTNQLNLIMCKDQSSNWWGLIVNLNN